MRGQNIDIWNYLNHSGFTAFDPLAENPIAFWDTQAGITRSGGNITRWDSYSSGPAYMDSLAGKEPQIDLVPTLNGHEVIRSEISNSEAMSIRNIPVDFTIENHYWCFVIKPKNNSVTQIMLEHNSAGDRMAILPSIVANGKYSVNDGVVKTGTVTHRLEWKVIEFINFNGTAKVYDNGVEMLSSTFATGKNIQATMGFLRSSSGFLSTMEADTTALFYKEATSINSNSTLVNGFMGRYALGTRLVFEGDSHMAELGGPSPPANSLPTLVSQHFDDYIPFVQDGTSGHTLADMDANSSVIDALPDTSNDRKIFVLWGGYNDIVNDGQTAAQTLVRLKTELTNRRAAGNFSAICLLSLPSHPTTAINDIINEYNTLVNTNFNDLRDNYGVSQVITLDPASASHKQTDNIHFDQTGIQLIADQVIAFVNSNLVSTMRQ